MTPDGRRLAIWTGSGAAILLAGIGWITFRAAANSETQASAETLHASYVKLYHPDKPEGFAVDKAQAELRTIAVAQADELHTAESQLAPALPSTYLVESLSEAAAQVTADYSALRQLSARTRIPIPASLPYESGLDADAKLRARQLANLSLVRQSLQSCLHAGVARITSVTPGTAFASPDAAYAIFTCDLDVECDWPAAARLLGVFAQVDGRGLGLRNLETTGAPDKPLRIRLGASLTVLNRDIWALGAAPAASPSGNVPAATNGDGGSRLRRLGGSRP